MIDTHELAMRHQHPRTDTRTTQVMETIRHRITQQALSPGERLPSIRALATNLGVSPSTVVTAYDRLAAEGLIRARPGAGFYVTGKALPPLALMDHQPEQDRAIDPLWVSRQSLDAGDDALKPGCGWLPPDWLPVEPIRRACRSLAQSGDAVLAEYGSTRGSQTVRRILRARWTEEGLDTHPDQLMLTASGTHAIDLICRFLLQPHDTVLVDDPCYFNFSAILRAHRARVVSVPYTQTGPDLEAFERVVTNEQPALYLTNSALQNPTGATLSPQVAHRLLNLAAAHQMTIVEDDIFADFEPDPSVRLAALDGLDRVIRIGSFSKTLSASVRCGYIAARADWIEDLVDLQVATSFGGPSPMAESIVASVLAGGGYRKHMHELRRRLERARHETAAQLECIGIEPWLLPRGGFYLWCRLPEGSDSAAVARAALAEQVVLAPGNAFSAAQAAAGFMRINVAQCQDPRVFTVLERAIARQDRFS